MGDETRELLQAGFSSWGIPISERQIDPFLAYRDLLVEWNATRMNLTRLISPRDIAVEHFLDSLSLLTVLDMAQGASLLDVGAGAGFPSLPLKILRPDLKVTLLEATAKKLTFCGAVVERLGLKDVRLVHGRAEQGMTLFDHQTDRWRVSEPNPAFGHPSLNGKGSGGDRFRPDDSLSHSGRGGRRPEWVFDVVTARAVSHLDKLASWCEPYMKRRGVFAAYKGARAEEEAAEAEDTLRRLRLLATVKPVSVPGSDKVHAIVLCRRTAP